jgi:hypothetical protein
MVSLSILDCPHNALSPSKWHSLQITDGLIGNSASVHRLRVDRTAIMVPVSS